MWRNEVRVTVRNRWLLLVSALAGYGLLWVGWVLQWTWLHTVDNTLLDAAYRHGVAHRGWVRGWKQFCDVFAPWTFQVTAAAVAVGALVRRHYRAAVFLLVCVVLTGTVTEIAKDVAQRPRPGRDLAYEPSWSFPSGHALATLVGVLGLTAVALTVVTPERRRLVWACAAIGLAVAVLVGVGRVMLNVHFPSDVLGGWLLGSAWFAGTLPILTGGRAAKTQIVSKP